MARRHVELCRRFSPDPVVVSTVAALHAPGTPAAEAPFDRGEPYRIVREPFGFAAAKRFSSQLAWSSHLTQLLREGIDVVHLGNIRPCGYAVEIATRRVATPYLVYVNGGDLLRERQKTATSLAKRWSARDIMGRAAGIVANSQWTATLTREVMAAVGIGKAPPVAAIDLGTDPGQFHPGRDTRTLRTKLGIGDAPVVLTVARLVPHKGQDTAIRALADSLGLGARVHLTGPLSDLDIAEAYATADVYVGLSRVDSAINAEGFGIAFVEASASATPCIAGDSGGVRSAVRDGETGFVVPPADVDAVSSALRALLGDAALRSAMGNAGRRAVESHYNWDRVARETLDFTRAVVSSPPRR